jgi:hypothetical protein
VVSSGHPQRRQLLLETMENLSVYRREPYGVIECSPNCQKITKHHISHQQQRDTRISATNTTTSPPTVVGRLGPPDPLGLPGTPGPLGVPGQPGTNGAVGPSGPSGVVGGNSLKLWKNLNEKDSHPCITMRSISINLEAIL